jgi:hypothetical protein
MNDREWMADALCAETDPEAFFPAKGDPATAAKDICGGCTVREQCLEYALKHGHADGIWGGLTPRKRAELSTRGRTPVRDRYMGRIRELNAKGMTDTDIAKQLGIPRTTVRVLRDKAGLPVNWGKVA